MKLNNQIIARKKISSNSTLNKIQKKLKVEITNYVKKNYNALLNYNKNKGYSYIKEKAKENINPTKFSFFQLLRNIKVVYPIPKLGVAENNCKTLFNKKYITRIKIKKKFNNFFLNNKLYNIFNIKQDFPYPNFLQLKSEIQRATVFRDLVNKEEGYYQAIKKSPLIILISPKPKNIYITVYTVPESNTGYNILWKKSTGMLQKVEGQLSLAALIEIFTKLNIFLTKEFLFMQSPVRLIIKSTKYYGTTNIIQNFVKIFEKNIKLNYIFFMYKYRKRFNFFTSYAKLINDSLFNYLSAIWLKFLKLIKKTKMLSKYMFSVPKLTSYNKFFGIEFNLARRKYKINHFERVKRIKDLQNKQLKFKNLRNLNQLDFVYQ